MRIVDRSRTWNGTPFVLRILIVVLMAMALPAAAQNLVNNPSFAGGVAGWFPGSAEGSTVSYSSARNAPGSAGGSGQLSFTCGTCYNQLFQYVTVAVGTTYEVSAKVLVLPTTGASLRATVSAGDAYVEVATESSSWVERSFEFTASSATGGTTAALVLGGYYFTEAPGNPTLPLSVFFDDVSVTAKTTCLAPTILVQPASQTIDKGQKATVAVSASGASLEYQWYAGERSVTATPLLGARSSSALVSPETTTKYWTRVTSLCGSVDSQAATITVVPPSPPPVIREFKAGPSTINNGQGAILSWKVDHAASISISSGVGTFPGGDGTRTVSPSTTTTYELTATGTAPSARATTTVTVKNEPPPVLVSIKANPKKVTVAGEPVSLLWSTVNASAAALNGESVALNGGRTATPQAPASTYTLVATKEGRSGSDSVTVPLVTEPEPQVEFSVSPPELSGPGDVTLRWSSIGGTFAWLDDDEVALSGEKTFAVAALKNFTLKVDGPGGTDAVTRGVLVAGEKQVPVKTGGGKAGEPGSNDGLGGNARFRNPSAVGTDGTGNVFVIDAGNHTIRRIDARTGEVSTWAGVPEQPGHEDDTATTKGRFDFSQFPGGFFVDKDGSMLVAEGPDRIRSVSAQGKISTECSSSCGGLGWEGLVEDASGNQYVTSANAVIKKTAAKQTVVIGSPAGEEGFRDGEAGAARFRSPSGLTLDNDGSVYVVDAGNNAIRRIGADGVVSTIAGETPSSSARRRSISAVEGGAFTFGGTGVAVQLGPDGLLYVPDPGTNTIKSVDPKSGRIVTVAGSGKVDGADGGADAAGFNTPRGLAIDAAGRIVVADTGNQTVRFIETRLAEQLLMLNDRFQVQVTYRNQFDGNREGALVGRSLSSSTKAETAIFTFGDPLVTELLVRLSDARPFVNNVQVYFGGVSDVEFTIKVTDTLTGRTKSYLKPANQPLGGVDRQTFPADPSASSALSVPEGLRQSGVGTHLESTLRLLNSRYEVRVRYRNQFANPVTTGYLVGQSIASSSTTETAIFTFGDPEVAEWMVRFSDARPFANRIDFFHGGVTDVELTLEVRDTVTGTTREYAKPPFSFLGAVDRVTWTP